MLWAHYKFQNKKVLKIFHFYFFTVYRVSGALVSGNFSPIGEYSSHVNNRWKWALANCCVGIKVLRKPIAVVLCLFFCPQIFVFYVPVYLVPVSVVIVSVSLKSLSITVCHQRICLKGWLSLCRRRTCVHFDTRCLTCHLSPECRLPSAVFVV